VAGIQALRDTILIRHAYVLPTFQRKGLGTRLLKYLMGLAGSHEVLVGTWTSATWAIRFYEKHGFELVSSREKDRLLRAYWNIPERQIETSVVLRIISSF
jgi:GNAT superfamily N-acetyltransferase